MHGSTQPAAQEIAVKMHSLYSSREIQAFEFFNLLIYLDNCFQSNSANQMIGGFFIEVGREAN